MKVGFSIQHSSIFMEQFIFGFSTVFLELGEQKSKEYL